MRYFGGKSKIAKDIASYINNIILENEVKKCNTLAESVKYQKKSQNILTHTHTHYVEPFCGSCNVASKVKSDKKTLNDKNNYLIAMFQALQNGWVPPSEVSVEEYYQAKQNMNLEPHIAGFIGFACSFAGKFWGGYARDNKGGNYALRGKNSILKKMDGLKNAEFTCKDFKELDYKDAIIYCDPPYKNTTPYYKSILGEFPYDDFIEWVKKQSENNLVFVSEYKHNLPDGAKIVLEIPSRTSIRGGDGNVIETIEILYTFN